MMFSKECDEWNARRPKSKMCSLFSIVFVAVADGGGGGGEHEQIDFHFSSFFFSLLLFSLPSPSLQFRLIKVCSFVFE